MTLLGPYRLLRTLGGCEAGTVWSAFDAEGTSVTVAVLNSAVANDTRLLHRFATEINTLAASGEVPILRADFNAQSPWVACGWDDDGPGAARLFIAQGLRYVPAVPAAPGQTPPPAPGPRATPAQPSPATTTMTIPPIPAPTIPPAPASTIPPASTAPPPTTIAEPPTGQLPPIPAAPTSPTAPLPPDPATLTQSAVEPPTFALPDRQSLGEALRDLSPTPPQPPTFSQPTRPLRQEDAPTVQFPTVQAPPPPPPPPLSRSQAPPALPYPGSIGPPPVPAAPTPAPYQQQPVAVPARGKRAKVKAPKAPKPPKPPKAPKVKPTKAQPSPKARRRRRGRRGCATIALVVAMFAIPAVVALLVIRPSGFVPQSPDSNVVARPAASGPGIEPPAAGEWPATWARFQAGDPIKRMSQLADLGFAFDVPPDWNCQDAGDDAIHYRCGAGFGQPGEIGGDVIVRTCAVCTPSTRVQMRGAEEAWRLQWIRADDYLVWAETTNFVGPPHYGLVMIGYWRSVEDGPVNRQIVVRMTAPAERVGEIQKVANSVRTEVRYGAP